MPAHECLGLDPRPLAHDRYKWNFWSFNTILTTLLSQLVHGYQIINVKFDKMSFLY